MKQHIIVIETAVLLLVVGLSGCVEQISDETSNNNDGSNNGEDSSEETASIKILTYDLTKYRVLKYDWHEIQNFGLYTTSNDGTVNLDVPWSVDIKDVAYKMAKRKNICLNYIEPNLGYDVEWNTDYWGYEYDPWTASDSAKVSLSNFQLSNEIKYWIVSGIAKNVGSEFLNRPKITVNFYNSADAWLAKETDTEYNIASGYTWNFEVTYNGKYKNDVDHIDFEFE